jgi:GR25 family glycosyltransferase involved in LPS biosynthesis
MPSGGFPPRSITCSAYINLDSRPDRRRNAERQMGKLQLVPRRICGEYLESEEDFARRFPQLASRPRSRFLQNVKNGPLGSLGCYISHLRAIESCPCDAGLSLICEDDVHMLSKNLKNWINYFAGMEFDVLIVDPQGDYDEADVIARNVYSISHGSPVYWGTHAYIINNASRSVILSELKKLPLDSFDHCLMDLRGQLKIYAVRTSMCWPKGSWGSSMARQWIKL